MLLIKFEKTINSLWESVKSNTYTFAPIGVSVRKLTEFDIKGLNKDDLKSISGYFTAIEDFFTAPSDSNEAVVKAEKTFEELKQILNKLKELDEKSLKKEVDAYNTKLKPKIDKSILIGYFNGKLWQEVKHHLVQELNIDSYTFSFNNLPEKSAVDSLKKGIEKSKFAIVILSKADDFKDDEPLNKQRFMQGYGLLQGMLGFDNVVLLHEKKKDYFSDIVSLKSLNFKGDNIEQTFDELKKLIAKRIKIKK